MPSSICFQQLGNVRDQRVIGVGVGKKGANTEQHLANCEGRTPLVLKDIKTDTPIGIDVAVVDACGEVHLGRLKGIISGEVNV